MTKNNVDIKQISRQIFFVQLKALVFNCLYAVWMAFLVGLVFFRDFQAMFVMIFIAWFFLLCVFIADQLGTKNIRYYLKTHQYICYTGTIENVQFVNRSLLTKDPVAIVTLKTDDETFRTVPIMLVSSCAVGSDKTLVVFFPTGQSEISKTEDFLNNFSILIEKTPCDSAAT